MVRPACDRRFSHSPRCCYRSSCCATVSPPDPSSASPSSGSGSSGWSTPPPGLRSRLLRQSAQQHHLSANGVALRGAAGRPRNHAEPDRGRRRRAHRRSAFPQVRSAQRADRRRPLMDGRPHPQHCSRGHRPELGRALAARRAADRARRGSHPAPPFCCDGSRYPLQVREQ